MKDREVIKERKQFEWKAEADGAGSLTGNANGLGLMDRGGDVVAPGAFKTCIPEFLAKGFMAVGHDWEGLPVGYFTEAKEHQGFLKVSAKFHTDDRAQRARTVVTERLEAGKFVGLSIGFLPDRDKCAWYESGKAMWKDMEEQGIHQGMDKPSILAWKGYCRLIKGVKELFEVSIVTVPMNQISGVTDAKSVDAEAENETPLAGKSFLDHSVWVLAATEEFVVRAEELSATRALDDRQLSDAHKARFKDLAARLLSLSEVQVTPLAKAQAAQITQQARIAALLAGAA